MIWPREIWSISGPFWSLPIAVEWPGEQRELAAIRIGGGIRLLDCQREAAEARLRELGAEYEQRGEMGKRWWIPGKTLEQHCRLEGNVDPQTVVEWRPPTRIRYGKQKSEQRKLRDEFFHEFCKGGLMNSPAKAEFLFTAFCKFMLHWLVNEQRPVDLGFCQLVPVPLRANWKSLLLQSHAGKSIQPQRLLRTIEKQVASKPEYTAWRLDKRYSNRNGKHIFWTLDVLPLRAWHVSTIMYERGRRAGNYRLKGEISRYIASVRDSIKRALPYLTRIYASYLSTVQRPGASLAQERRAPGATPETSKPKRGEFVFVDPARVVHPAYDARSATPVAPVELGDPDQADRDLREVPDLPSEVPDVRQPGGYVAESQDGQSRTDGLPVPDGRGGLGEV